MVGHIVVIVKIMIKDKELNNVLCKLGSSFGVGRSLSFDATNSRPVVSINTDINGSDSKR